MCHASVHAFISLALSGDEVRGKRVLEVGSYDVNGSVRPYIEGLGPASYLGVDMQPGPRVDRVVRAEALLEEFGSESFDIVISTEMLEHAEDWRSAVRNMMCVLSAGGVLIVTTRSAGFPFHGFPHDYWRYGVGDFERILAEAGFERQIVDLDPQDPGIFVKAMRPQSWTWRGEATWTAIELERPAG